MPVNVIMILVDWYKNSVGTVNWKGFLSSSFPLQAGVRQGGCISPINFAILVDDVITAIHNSGLGCHINNINFGILMYADDLVLVSASIFKLQLMVDICLGEFNSLDLKINVKKSACIRIGKNFNSNCSQIVLNNNALTWSNNFKYLGVLFNSGKKVSLDLKSSRSKFFRSFNCIYSKISRANESVVVSLLKTCCIPILMYSVESIDLNKTELNRLQNPVSLAFGKIFKTFDNSTIRSCMFYMNLLPLNYEYICRKVNFLTKLRSAENNLLVTLFSLFGSKDLLKLCSDYRLNVGNGAVNTVIKKKSWELFSASLGI